MSHSEIATNSRKHALVIGSSMAGLLAARVLSDYFEQVTIVESDFLPTRPEWRKGVPQSHHVHVLLTTGLKILEQLFPGLPNELAAVGAPRIDWTADFPVLQLGGWAPRFSSNLKMRASSRNLLEWSIRNRLVVDNKVRFLQGTQVIGLLSDTSNTCVTGVRVRARHDHDLAELSANLVVDTSGRNSLTPQWLTELGYASPEETVINSFLGYASRWYQRPTHFPSDWQAVYVLPKPPHQKRGGGVYSVEENRWIATLVGVGRDYPPTDEAGFLDFARTMRSPVVYEVLKDAKPLSPIYGYRRTENRLRHYEKLSHLPENFIVIGDAVCAFNPIYGQGMSVAALGALTLNRCLKQQHRGDLVGLSKRFQKQLAKVNTTPWLIATGEDLRWQTTEGGRPNLVTRLLHRYFDEVTLLAVESPYTYKVWSEVMHLEKPPTAFFQPGILARLLYSAIYPRRESEGNGPEQRIPERGGTQEHPYQSQDGEAGTGV
jgi:2-polyprenyl-6-methoxyphenol hydroxylase-like FAD-dependent oxidoreductase